jgi:26S proteasome non-ATPase regulatory subunit 10
MIKILLDAKSPLNATDVDGMTALHHAVCEGHGDAALLLLTMGADFEKEDKDGKRPLDLVPDAKVGLSVKLGKESWANAIQTRTFIVQAAEREGIDLE